MIFILKIMSSYLETVNLEQDENSEVKLIENSRNLVISEGYASLWFSCPKF